MYVSDIEQGNEIGILDELKEIEQELFLLQWEIEIEETDDDAEGQELQLIETLLQDVGILVNEGHLNSQNAISLVQDNLSSWITKFV